MVFISEDLGVEVAKWTRGCCLVDGPGILCTETHEEDFSGRLDISWYKCLILLVCFPITSPFSRCDTNDCNTMDPRTGSAKSLVPAALTILFAAVAVMA